MQSQFGMQPAILVLKDGTDTTQGKGQLITAINACKALADIIATTLGPRGTDKMIVKGLGDDKATTVTNDGASILSLLDIKHPAARVLSSISKSQDSEVGDGTTSVCLLSGSLLNASLPLLDENVNPRIIAKNYKKALKVCIDTIQEIKKTINVYQSPEDTKEISLFDIAQTSLNSKLIKPFKEHFAEIILQALGYKVENGRYQLIDNSMKDTNEKLSKQAQLQQYHIIKLMGDSLAHSFYFPGIAFPRGFTYAGADKQPKFIQNAKILLLNLELELQSSQQGATVECNDTASFEKLLDAEFKLLKEKLDKIASSGATVVVSTKSIGDIACSYFGDHNILSVGRCQLDDINRISKLLQIPVLSAVQDITVESNIASVEECKVEKFGPDEVVFIKHPQHSKQFTGTIVLRGPSSQFLDESERSLHDALSITRVTLRNPDYIAGAGSIECFLSSKLRQEAKQLSGKPQAVFEAFAKALEIIPTQLADNAGFDSVEILNQLRYHHNKAIKAHTVCFNGINIEQDNTTLDAMEAHIVEPANIRINALQSAVEATCTILLIDQTFNLPNDAENVEKSKKERKDIKKKLDKAGIRPSVNANGTPSPELQSQMSQAAQRVK